MTKATPIRRPAASKGTFQASGQLATRGAAFSLGLRLHEQPFFERALIEIRVCCREAIEFQDGEDLLTERIRWASAGTRPKSPLPLSSPAPI